MADDRDSLLREVDEELRRDQMQKLWEQYNGIIIGGFLAIVLAVGGYKVMQSRKIAAAEAAGAEYQAALDLIDNKKADEAEKALSALTTGGSSGYAALARLQLAGAQLKAGKTADALTTFEVLAKDGSADDLLKTYAQLQAASLRMGDADFAEMQNRLLKLAEEGGAFKISAREMLGFAAYKAGNLAEARKYFEPLLIDPNASRQIQERIKIVMTRIAAAEIEKTGAPAPAVAPAAPEAAPASAGPPKPSIEPAPAAQLPEAEAPQKADSSTATGTKDGAAASLPDAKQADAKQADTKQADTKQDGVPKPGSGPSTDQK